MDRTFLWSHGSAKIPIVATLQSFWSVSCLLLAQKAYASKCYIEKQWGQTVTRKKRGWTKRQSTANTFLIVIESTCKVVKMSSSLYPQAPYSAEYDQCQLQFTPQ